MRFLILDPEQQRVVFRLRVAPIQQPIESSAVPCRAFAHKEVTKALSLAVWMEAIWTQARLFRRQI